VSTVPHPSTTDHDGPGITILPGAVVVDMAAVDVLALTPADLREAFDESAAQLAEAELSAEDLLGNLDINPL